MPDLQQTPCVCAVAQVPAECRECAQVACQVAQLQMALLGPVEDVG